MKYDVTIGIPIYKSVGYIRRSIESALNQSYFSIEFLIIDDGGSDGSIDPDIIITLIIDLPFCRVNCSRHTLLITFVCVNPFHVSGRRVDVHGRNIGGLDKLQYFRGKSLTSQFIIRIKGKNAAVQSVG